jgi:hypothetical protein
MLIVCTEHTINCETRRFQARRRHEATAAGVLVKLVSVFVGGEWGAAGGEHAPTAWANLWAEEEAAAASSFDSARDIDASYMGKMS